MPDQRQITCYEFPVTPTEIILRALPLPDPAALRLIYMMEMRTYFESGGGGTFPAIGDVDVTSPAYGPTGSEYSGTLLQPDEADVLLGIQYGAGGIEFTGTLVGGGLASGTILLDPATGIRYLFIKDRLILQAG